MNLKYIYDDEGNLYVLRCINNVWQYVKVGGGNWYDYVGKN